MTDERLREALVTKVCDLLWEHGVYLKDSTPLAEAIVRALAATPETPTLRERIKALPEPKSSHPNDEARTQYHYGWDDAIAAVLALLGEPNDD